MPKALAVLAAALLLALGASVPAAADDGGFTIDDPRITESSGLAASRQHPGVYWTHNDSDDGPYLYAVDSRTGKTVATLTLKGIGEPRDVEAISVGPGNELWVGDIGDNMNGAWDHVWIYRLPEPKELKDATVRAVQYNVRYADGPRDAESMMVHPKTGRVYIVSKVEGGGALYEGPKSLAPQGMNVFRKVAPIDLWATDGAFSPDGKRLAVRSYLGGRKYRWEDGRPVEDGTLAVPIQRQGESMTYSADGRALLFGTEGGGSSVESVEVAGSGDGKPSAPSGSGGGASDAAGGSRDRKLYLGVLVGAGVIAVVSLGRRASRRR
ncbi:hypothetical protein SRB5_31480 [Streptomyces sp. RB5]|uniref:WD40 repeat domain-containing protein n=1 Tax=Streptomyces smaragdinus TaxID=2585196 RepID=A0A7K0CHQ9_9ACTN|nr:WD40 repeat domain-containing protein [Streptomyces smaragdinus]MQY13008.1 hypothetical protein [Streptomyces smaragdinus]